MNCRCRNSPWCDFEWNTRGWYSQLDRGIGRLTWEQLPKSSWCILGTTHQDDWCFRGIWRNSDPIWIIWNIWILPNFRFAKYSLSHGKRCEPWFPSFPAWKLGTSDVLGSSWLTSLAFGSQVWYHLRFNLWQSIRGPSGKSWRGVKDGVGNMSQAMPSNIFKAFKPLQDSRLSAWYQKILHNQYDTEAIYKPVRAFHSPFCCRCYSSTGKLVAGPWVAARQPGRRNYTGDRTFRFAALCLSPRLVFS